MSGPDSERYAAAAGYLRELLLQPGRYRQRWAQYAERTRPGAINQLAVADVLAHYLWSHPRSAGDADVLPRQLKDTVLRAVSGRMISKASLRLFIDAFDLAGPDAELLWRLWEGEVRVQAGPRAMQAERPAALGPLKHQTLALHDHHYLGAEARPVRHRTLQVIEATVGGLDRIPFHSDSADVALEVGLGCRGVTGPYRKITDVLYATDILLAKSLARGETLTLEYWLAFKFTDRPESDYRRASRLRMENIDIRVEFHPEMLPATIWWASWDGIEGEVVAQQAASLDSQHSVHHYLRTLENAVVGFHWAW
ncbi:MAG TPA: hypothetical protein VLW50_04895 [Streptosporangiaceae bacterium]|nr:hypothetical protein [Streptosporangiaceae bacterium]